MANLVADARALAAGQYPHLVVYGSALVGDGGGGFYIWSAAATNLDDGADWLKPTAITHPDPGRWQRVWSAVQIASTTVAGLVQLGANGDTTPGEAVQCSDTRLHPAAGMAGNPAYLTIDAGTQVITRALIDLASHVTGNLPAGNLGSGTGATAQTTLHGDMTWKFPAERAIITETGTTRTNTAADQYQYVRFTNTGAKTPAVNGSVAAVSDVWIWANMAATGDMTISAGTGGMVLAGKLKFEPYRAASIVFTSATAADVIGGIT